MKQRILEAVVVGGGPAGLSAAYYLKKYEVDHLVFEKGRTGESWRSQRWQSFRLNSPNWLNELPGQSFFDRDPNGFCSAPEFAASLDDYVQRFQLPVREHSRVQEVRTSPDGNGFVVDVLDAGRLQHYSCRQVIIASGSQCQPVIPAMAGQLPPNLVQRHAGAYRQADDLPAGPVLVVGSAQSGCQIAEDLADSGREVYLATSAVARVPRRYRGKDIHEWLLDLKFFDIRKEAVSDPAQLHMRAPQLTGTGQPPRTMSLQALARKGVRLMGTLLSIEEDQIHFSPNAAEHVRTADESSKMLKDKIDAYILQSNLHAPPPDDDPEDLPDTTFQHAGPVTSVDWKAAHIQSIIWATGFQPCLDYLPFPVVDKNGHLLQQDGMAAVKGMYFLGFPWLRNRKSALLCGIREDAACVVQRLCKSKTETLEGRKISAVE